MCVEMAASPFGDLGLLAINTTSHIPKTPLRSKMKLPLPLPIDPIFGIKPFDAPTLRIYRAHPCHVKKSSPLMLAAYIHFQSILHASLVRQDPIYSVFASGSGKMPSASSLRRASSRAQVWMLRIVSPRPSTRIPIQPFLQPRNFLLPSLP
jgi:hypothetical protein